MALSTNPFVLELQNLALELWPELIGTSGGGGVFQAQHISRVKWEALTYPCAVVVLEETKPWEGRPLAAMIYQVTAAVYYADRVSGTSAPLRTKLEALEAACWPGQPLTTAKRLRLGELDDRDELPANLALRKNNPNARTALFRCTFLLPG